MAGTTVRAGNLWPLSPKRARLKAMAGAASERGVLLVGVTRRNCSWMDEQSGATSDGYCSAGWRGDGEGRRYCAESSAAKAESGSADEAFDSPPPREGSQVIESSDWMAISRFRAEFTGGR